MRAIITLLIIGLTLYLWGCGDDTEETDLVQIPTWGAKTSICF